ncbi:MAG: hypothetical protein Q6366_017535, partial [Candidatus Freyarchaeota archaeon]
SPQLKSKVSAENRKKDYFTLQFFIVRGIEIVTAVDIRNDVGEILLGRDVLQHLNIDIDCKKGNVGLRDP